MGNNHGDPAEVRGVVKKVFFNNGDWSSGKILSSETGRIIGFAGTVSVQDDDRVTLRGTWELHPKYGMQVKATDLEMDMELDQGALADWLAKSKELAGIGPSRANAIAKYHATFEEELKDPTAFSEKTGVEISMIQTLADEWDARAAQNRAIVALGKFDVSAGKAKKLVDAYGIGVVGIVQHNPYWLVGRVTGFGFKTVDKFALAGGTPKNDPGRIRAGISWILETEENDGHTWLGEGALASAAVKEMALDGEGELDAVKTSIEALIEDGTLVRGGQGKAIFRRQTYKAEATVWDFFRDRGKVRLDAPPSISSKEFREAYGSMTHRQEEAVMAALTSKLSVITGGAGTGKTFSVQAIVDAHRAMGKRVALCAPTAKAAIRMEEMVPGMSASTIHRLLEPEFITKAPKEKRREDEIEDDGERDPDVNDPRDQMKFGFARGRNNKVDADVVIVDEVSMVDVRLMRSLVDAIADKTQLVLVGDHHQLPSVGPGAILRDVIRSQVCPVVVLDEILRSAGELSRNVASTLDGIVQRTSACAGAPAQGEAKPISPWYVFDSMQTLEDAQRCIETLFRSKLDQYDIPIGEKSSAPGHVVSTRKIDPLVDVQVLTPKHDGPAGTVELNKALQRIFQAKNGVEVPPPPPPKGKGKGKPPRGRPMVGDKVVCTKNQYSLGVMNGQMGIVYGAAKGTLTILFDGQDRPLEIPADKTKHIDLAYAMTIHKSQGSEWPVIILVIHRAHGFMLHRGMIYTGVSRARESTMILGDSYGIRACANSIKSDQRRTMLMLEQGVA